MAGTIYQGDIGLEILLDCGRDVSGADDAAILVKTPSGAVMTWPAGKKAADGTVTSISYVTRVGDLAEAGTYRLQASLTLGDWAGLGKTATLVVRAKFS